MPNPQVIGQALPSLGDMQTLIDWLTEPAALEVCSRHNAIVCHAVWNQLVHKATVAYEEQ
jgi:hypothetical protein